MKTILFLSAFLFFHVSWASRVIDITPIQLQYRYEDSSDQARETLQYQSYGAALQYNEYRGLLRYSSFADHSGNAALHFETEIKEYMSGAGYQIYRLEDSINGLSLSVFINGLLGVSKTRIRTHLLGSTSEASSDLQMVYGIGASLVGRLKYFVLETEWKLLNSRNFSPQVVPAVLIKIGVGIPF